MVAAAVVGGDAATLAAYCTWRLSTERTMSMSNTKGAAEQTNVNCLVEAKRREIKFRKG